ncbi:regulator of G-protein signaling 3-like [Glandiceps talaboti]
MSTDLTTHVLSQGLADLALKTPPPMKRRRVDALRGDVDLLQNYDFPNHVLVPPPPIHWTVIRAKGLPRIHGHFCGTYVIVSVVSGCHRRREMITKLVGDVTRPYFEEVFRIDFTELKCRDRILITLYRQQDGKSDIMGCMSFGVKHLLQETKIIDGWYYLLNEELGIKKHLAAPSKKKKCHSDGRKHKGPIRVIKKVMTIMQGKQGYGFTILDTTPVRVGKVDQGGPAEQVGLQMGDILIRINKYHVERLPCPDIITIVKNAPGHLRIVIERRAKRTTTTTTMTTTPMRQDEMRKPLGLVSANCTDMRRSMRRHNHFGVYNTTKSSTCSSDTYPPSEDEELEVKVFGSMEEAREAAVQQLCSYEGSFASSLHYGVEDYLKPLRFNLHMSTEFSRLYTALEQMTVICGYHVQQLELRLAAESSPAKKTQSSKPEIITIGDVYLGKLDEFMSAYAVYQSSVRMVESEMEAVMQHQNLVCDKLLRELEDLWYFVL